jgi:p-methyltransferase
MRNRLDLLLLGDHIVTPEFSRYKVVSEKIYHTLSPFFIFSEKEKDAITNDESLQSLFLPVDPDSNHYLMIKPNPPSLALANIASVARQKGYTTAIVDNIFSLPFRFKQMEEIINEYKPRLIGLSTTFMLGCKAVKRAVATINRMAPYSKKLLGGPTARRYPQLHGLCDFVVFGAGERAIVEILEALTGKRDIHLISNIAYRDKIGRLCYGPGGLQAARVGRLGIPYKFNKNQRIPIPDWTLYHRDPSAFYPIEFSRGCNNNCFFCAYDRGKVFRELQEIKQELVQNANCGIFRYRVCDSDFAARDPHRPRYPNEICQLIKKQLSFDLEWTCFVRADSMDDKIADLMTQAGCFAIQCGIESGDDRILKSMRKGYTVAQAKEGIRIAKKHGIYIQCQFIVGYPGETEETFENTLAFIEETRPDLTFFSQYYLENESLISNPKNRTLYKLEGEGSVWKHATMDSTQANQLIAQGIDRLFKAGINIGSESEFGWWGFQVDVTKRMLPILRTFSSPYTADTKRKDLLKTYKHILHSELVPLVVNDICCMSKAMSAVDLS